MFRFMLHIFGAFAESERKMIRERTISGVRSARAKGKKLGKAEREYFVVMKSCVFARQVTAGGRLQSN